MRPDIPQKTGTAPSNSEDRSPLVDNRESVTSEVSRPSCNRAAAIFSIAISVGAGSLVVPSFQGVAQANESGAAKQVSAGEPIVLETSTVESLAASGLPETPQSEYQTAAKSPAKGSAAQTQKPADPLPSNRKNSAKVSSPKVAVISESRSDRHAVKPGETLWQIAKAYKVDVRALANVNKLSTGSVLKVGQFLSLPTSKAAAVPDGVVKLGAVAASVPEIPQLSDISDDDRKSSVAVDSDAAAALSRSGNDQLKQSTAELVEESGESDIDKVETEAIANRSVATSDEASEELPVTDLSRVDLPAVGGKEPAVTAQEKVAAKSLVVADADEEKTEFNPKPLLSEIRDLRDRYNNKPVVKRIVTQKRNVAVIAKADVKKSKAAVKIDDAKVEPLRSDAVAANPDFAGRKSESALSIELRNFVQPKLKPEAKEKVNSAPTSNRQVVARATFGSQAYAPLTPAVKKMVSPDLPAIGSEDAYLPGGKISRGYVWPAKGILSSGYGWRWGRMHRGIDIAAPVGTPIVASAAGVVTYARWNNGGYGYLVEVEHADGTMTRYAHNNRILVKEGQKVAQGQQVSEMGSTGFSTGPHLHFEIHPRGRGAINPMAMLHRQS